jgi:hypothetical protein
MKFSRPRALTLIGLTLLLAACTRRPPAVEPRSASAASHASPETAAAPLSHSGPMFWLVTTPETQRCLNVEFNVGAPAGAGAERRAAFSISRIATCHNLDFQFPIETSANEFTWAIPFVDGRPSFNVLGGFRRAGEPTIRHSPPLPTESRSVRVGAWTGDTLTTSIGPMFRNERACAHAASERAPGIVVSTLPGNVQAMLRLVLDERGVPDLEPKRQLIDPLVRLLLSGKVFAPAGGVAPGQCSEWRVEGEFRHLEGQLVSRSREGKVVKELVYDYELHRCGVLTLLGPGGHDIQADGTRDESTGWGVGGMEMLRFDGVGDAGAVELSGAWFYPSLTACQQGIRVHGANRYL